MAQLSAVEMFGELVRQGYFVPASVEPSAATMPTAYVNAPTSLAFATPPIHTMILAGTQNAKLEPRSQGDSEGD